MLYTEIVRRRFVTGTLAGIEIEQRIPRVSQPRAVGSAHAIGAYVDTILRVEPYEPGVGQ